jgi:RHS repeat-associated protein
MRLPLRRKTRQRERVLAALESDSLAASEWPGSASAKTDPTQKTRVWNFFGERRGTASGLAAQMTETASGCSTSNYKSASGRSNASIYDPQTAREIGVSVNSAKAWKVYNNRGDLEATIVDATRATKGVLTDNFGNGVASVSGSTVSWYATRCGAYGPLPGIAAQPLIDVTLLAEASAWHGYYIDPTGFYHFGMRYYDPVSGRWLSCDPLGFAASTSLYEFCANDPLNSFDPSGCCPESSNNDSSSYLFGSDGSGNSSSGMNWLVPSNYGQNPADPNNKVYFYPSGTDVGQRFAIQTAENDRLATQDAAYSAFLSKITYLANDQYNAAMASYDAQVSVHRAQMGLNAATAVLVTDGGFAVVASGGALAEPVFAAAEADGVTAISAKAATQIFKIGTGLAYTAVTAEEQNLPRDLSLGGVTATADSQIRGLAGEVGPAGFVAAIGTALLDSNGGPTQTRAQYQAAQLQMRQYNIQKGLDAAQPK